MEQNETFKSVEAKIKKLEDQLSLYDETIKQCEQSGMQRGEGGRGKGRGGREEGVEIKYPYSSHVIRKRDIEEHFAKCINSLAQRKAMLLKVSEKVVIHCMILSISFHLLLLSSLPSPLFIYQYVNTETTIEDTRAKLVASIEGCKLTLKGGSATYIVSPSSTEDIWKVYSFSGLSPLPSPSSFVTPPSPFFLLILA